MSFGPMTLTQLWCVCVCVCTMVSYMLLAKKGCGALLLALSRGCSNAVYTYTHLELCTIILRWWTILINGFYFHNNSTPGVCIYICSDMDGLKP